MIKRIKLESNSGRLLDREPFLMAENEKLNIEFETEITAKVLELEKQVTVDVALKE